MLFILNILMNFLNMLFIFVDLQVLFNFINENMLIYSVDQYNFEFLVNFISCMFFYYIFMGYQGLRCIEVSKIE